MAAEGRSNGTATATAFEAVDVAVAFPVSAAICGHLRFLDPSPHIA
jgi:hypothetical protein